MQTILTCTHGRVSDLAFRHGDIKVHTDEDALALEVKVGDGELVRNGHGRGVEGCEEIDGGLRRSSGFISRSLIR